MYGSALIVFREVLEASLIIGIVMAATRGIAGRGWWISAGVMGGFGIAIFVALFADRLAMALGGMGQEVFNAGILLAAVTMLAWHHAWMSRHAIELTRNVRAIGAEVLEGNRSLYALILVVGLAVMREGSELVLLFYGLAASGNGNSVLLEGGALGLVAGIIVGAALYRGLRAIPARYFFRVTTWMILLLAAGMAAQSSRYLVQAGYLPELTPLWDTSHALPMSSVTGQLLHVLLGYDPAPGPVQITFYATVLVTFLLLGRQMKTNRRAVALSNTA